MDNNLKRLLVEELTKTEVNDMIKSKLGTNLKSRDFESKVRGIVIACIYELYKSLWSKKSVWSSDLKK